MSARFFLYLFVMAGVTYLVRMLPLVLVRKEIRNRYVLAFLHYLPYTVLSSMTVPAVFGSTSGWISAAAGFAVALLLSLKKCSLTLVALAASAAALATDLLSALF